MTIEMGWEYDDGGRAAAGFRGDTGDCVTRAIAIAAELDYREVYDALTQRQVAYYERREKRTGRKQTRARTARTGVSKKVYKPFLRDELGWLWTPTMFIGSGTTVHLRGGELPFGRIIAEVSGHVVAVIYGTVRDTYDPRRDGTRCVYGYWSRP